LGLVESHAVFAVYPLLIAALSGPVLGEKVGWRRWVAIGIGFVGVLIILQPGFGVFQPAALIPLAGCLHVRAVWPSDALCRARGQRCCQLFLDRHYGAVTMTAIGIWFWEPMAQSDWLWMGLLCLTSAFSHYLLIRAYEVAEASAVQPFAYLQLPFAAALGILVFHEAIRTNVLIGAGVVVGAGLFTLWRARVSKA
jgi:drug/metabolite transporter (DMT)-like permease